MLIITALAIVALAVPSAASATVYTYDVKLSAEIQDATGVPGDPGAKGRSVITMDDQTNQVCATTSWTGVDSPVVAGHIHGGAYGEPENPAVTISLFPADFVNGVSSPQTACTTVAPGVIALIAACPKNYNVVVHSQDHPAGALRGQLKGRGCTTPA